MIVFLQSISSPGISLGLDFSYFHALFHEHNGGGIVLSNNSANALLKAQNAFSGLAENLGLDNEEDVQILVDSVRGEVKVLIGCTLFSSIANLYNTNW